MRVELTEPDHALFFRVVVAVGGFVVDELWFPVDLMGKSQTETIGDLICDTEFRVAVAACSLSSDTYGGCSPDVMGWSRTSSCSPLFPPPFPAPPPQPPSPSAPPSPLPPTGCKDPSAVNFDADAVLSDEPLCRAIAWGCTLPGAVNFDAAANANDGSCIFRRTLCIATLTAWPFTSSVGMIPWPVEAHLLDDGTNCSIGQVRFGRCLALYPPTPKSRDAVLSFPNFPQGSVDVTAEVGLHSSSRPHGSARFEMRAVTRRGDVVASDSVVRGRTSALSVPTVLRVSVDDAEGLTLQLRVTNEDGDGYQDLAIWGGPIVQCQDSCPCAPAIPSDTNRVDGAVPSPDISGLDRGISILKHLASGDLTAGDRDSLVLLAGALVGGGLVFLVCACGCAIRRRKMRTRSRRGGEGKRHALVLSRREDHEFDCNNDDLYDETLRPMLTLIGDVRVSRCNRGSNAGERDSANGCMSLLELCGDSSAPATAEGESVKLLLE